MAATSGVPKPKLSLRFQDGTGIRYSFIIRPSGTVGGGKGVMPEEQLFSGHVTILLEQLLELRAEVAMLKGKPLGEALDEAFSFLDTTTVFANVMDEEKATTLKNLCKDYFVERDNSA